MKSICISELNLNNTYPRVTMSLQTNLAGRIRNTDLPKSHALMPVFEAVVNSIHAIEETKNLVDGKITLDIIDPCRQIGTVKLGRF